MQILKGIEEQSYSLKCTAMLSVHYQVQDTMYLLLYHQALLYPEPAMIKPCHHRSNIL